MMNRLVKFGLILLVIIALFFSCTPEQPLWWHEHEDRFYTNDLNRAQEEIPFPIITLDYVPKPRFKTGYVHISGCLKEYQYEGKAFLELYYPVNFVNASVITLSEDNSMKIRVNPYALDPHWQMVDMCGKKVAQSVTNDYESSMFIFFNNWIQYALDFDYVPLDEATKVVESMLKQF